MRNVVRWEPLGDVMSLRRSAGRLPDGGIFDRSGWMPPLGEGDLAVDMFETDNDLVVSTALPGVKPEDVQITVTGDSLCITAESKVEAETQTASFYQRERRYGTCGRSLILPVAVQVDKAEARFKDGVLTLTLPKAEAARPRAIPVKAAAQ